MGRTSRTDRASDQNAYCQRAEPRLRLPGLALSGWPEMAPPEKPTETAGQTASAHTAHQRAESESNHRSAQPDPARLAWLLPPEQPHGPARPGRVVATTAASGAEQAAEATRLRSKSNGQPTLAQPMVCGARIV